MICALRAWLGAARDGGAGARDGFARTGSKRFAFKTAPQNTSWRDMLAVWQEADDIDLFESGWTFDHFYPIFSDSAGPCLEGWVTLTALAQATRRLRLGTLVTGIHYRDPLTLNDVGGQRERSPNRRLCAWLPDRCGRLCCPEGSLWVR